MTSPKTQTPSTSSTATAGAILGALVGAVLVLYSLTILLAGADQPISLKLALLIAGVAEIALCWLAVRRDRVGWSFAVALNGALALACFFGSPKVRDILDVDLVVSIIPSLIFAVTTVLLALAARDFD